MTGDPRPKSRAAAAARRPHPPHSNPKQRGVQLDPRQSYRSAMRELIAIRWGELWQAVPVALAGKDIEGVHDVRVASRRLRAAMDVAVECFPANWYRPLHQTAKEITGALGEVRDRDVLIAGLMAERDQVPPVERPGLDHLIERVEAERMEARAEMEEFLRRLVTGGVSRQVERRFGAKAAAPASLTSDAGPRRFDESETPR